MKKTSRIFNVFIVLAFMCSVSIFASEARASLYISAYRMNALPAGNGKLGVEFSINGTRQMSALGAESIIVYRADGFNWIKVAEFNRNDSDMIGTNRMHYGNTKFYQGIPEERYKVTVTVFAENDTGYDSRTENFIFTV